MSTGKTQCTRIEGKKKMNDDQTSDLQVKLSKCSERQGGNDILTKLHEFYNKLCMDAVERNLAALKIESIDAENAREDVLRIYLTNAAKAMQAVLGSTVCQIPEYIKTELERVSVSDINKENINSLHDAPAFLDFVYGYTTFPHEKYHSGPKGLKDNNGLFYKKNKAGIIACIAFKEYVINSSTKFKIYDYNSLISFQDSHYLKLMCIFANLTWRVFEIMNNRTAKGDFGIETSELLTNKKYEYTMKKDIVQIKAAAFALQENSGIYAFSSYADKPSENTELKAYFNKQYTNFANKQNVIDFLKEMKDYQGAPPPATQGGAYKKTDKRVTIGGRQRVVYVGQRGGQYVKSNGSFVKLPKNKN